MSPVPITAAALGTVAHGFFTREGGVSQGLHASLNCGRGSEDDPEAVAENRRRVAAHFGAGDIVTAAQVHSPEAVIVRGPWPGPPPRADALVTDRPGLVLAVLSADCAPVLLADPEARVAGAAHAGWRGALGGVLEATVAAMGRLGAQPARIAAAIGPCISQPAYEVGPDLVERVLEDDPAAGRFVAGGRGDRSQFDLPGYVGARLGAAGVTAVWTGHCTHGEPARFFSHRRSRQESAADYGRLCSAIRLG